MKRTQIIELYSNIKKTIITFLSIGIIAALGIAVFLGTNFASQGLKNTNNKRYQAEKFRDFEAVSAFGFTAADVAAMQKLPEVETAVGSYSVGGIAEFDAGRKSVQIMSKSDGVNQGSISSGKYPKQAGECAVEERFAKKYLLEPGDEIVLEASKSGKDCLNATTYTVTGTMSYIGGNDKKGYILLNDEAFQKETFNQCYTSILIRIKGSDATPIYSQEYEKLVKSTIGKIKETGNNRINLRYQEITQDVDSQLAGEQQKLDQAGQELKTAKEKIDAGQKQIDDAQKQIAAEKKRLAGAEDAIAAAQIKLLEGKSELDVADARLQENYNSLLYASQQLEKTRASIDKSWAELTIAEQNPLMEEGDKKSLAVMRAQLDIAEAEYAASLTEYQQKYQLYEGGMSKYQASLTEYQTKKAEFDAAKQQLEQGQQELLAARQRLAAAKTELADNKKKYQEGQKKYQEGESELAAAQKQGEQILAAECILYPRTAISSYQNIKANANNLASLGVTFAMTFVIVAVLVCYTSIGRMVEEQRTLIGVQKAQGFFVSEIRKRYLLYAAISTVFGIILGILTGYFFIQRFILNIYSKIDNFKQMETTFLLPLTIVICVSIIAITLLSAQLACNHILKTPATELMRDVAPVTKNHIWSQFTFWQRLPLFTRTVISNVVSDKRRAVTITIGIAGCTILLVTGFSLKMSADQAPEIQYSGVIKYDSVLTVTRSIKDENLQAAEKVLKDGGCEFSIIASKVMTQLVGDNFNSILMICADESSLENYIDLKDSVTGQKLAIPAEGILLSQGTAEAYGLGVGDSLTTIDTRGRQYEFHVRGIIEHYIGQKIIISPAYYKKIYGSVLKPNQYYIYLNGADEKELKEQLFKLDGINRLDPADSGQSDFKNMATTLDSILLFLIVLSAIMSVVILLNLAIMHIRKKARELAVMRVNGFTIRETKRYLQWETIVITGMGIIIGIAIGAVMCEQVLGMLGNQALQLKGGAKPLSWLLAAAVTMFFSIVVNGLAMQKIKKLKLNNVDAN